VVVEGSLEYAAAKLAVEEEIEAGTNSGNDYGVQGVWRSRWRRKRLRQEQW
jgi:hypothetical protein